MSRARGCERPQLNKSCALVLNDTMKFCWTSFPGQKPTATQVKDALGDYTKEMSAQGQQPANDLCGCHL